MFYSLIECYNDWTFDVIDYGDNIYEMLQNFGYLESSDWPTDVKCNFVLEDTCIERLMKRSKRFVDERNLLAIEMGWIKKDNNFFNEESKRHYYAIRLN